MSCLRTCTNAAHATVLGAYLSGLREAQRIQDLLQLGAAVPTE